MQPQSNFFNVKDDINFYR